MGYYAATETLDGIRHWRRLRSAGGGAEIRAAVLERESLGASTEQKLAGRGLLEWPGKFTRLKVVESHEAQNWRKRSLEGADAGV